MRLAAEVRKGRDTNPDSITLQTVFKNAKSVLATFFCRDQPVP